MRAGAAAAELLPRPPITRDQLTMLEAGDNVGDLAPAVETFGIDPFRSTSSSAGPPEVTFRACAG